MASGDDPLADYQNLIGFQGLVGPNPYLTYQGAIPMAGYQGTPTDASGNPIQSFLDAQAAHDAWNKANPTPTPGTTLNNTQYSPADYIAKGAGLLDPGQGPTLSVTDAQGPNGLSSWAMSQFPTSSQQLVQSMAGGGQSGQPIQPQQPAVQPQNPIDMRQAYLNALANPGKVITPGAQAQPGSTPTGAPQPSVLQAFLSQHPSGGTQIPGGYGNQSFFNTLNKLQSMQPGAAT